MLAHTSCPAGSRFTSGPSLVLLNHIPASLPPGPWPDQQLLTSSAAVTVLCRHSRRHSTAHADCLPSTLFSITN